VALVAFPQASEAGSAALSAPAPARCAGAPLAARALLAAGDAVTLRYCSEWLFDMPWYLGYCRFVPFLLLSPVYLAMRTTIVLVDSEFFSAGWLLLASFAYPLFWLFYMGQDVWSLAALGVALGIGAATAGPTALLLRRRTSPTAFDAWYVGSVDVATLVYSLLGMATAALWVALLAGELVGAVSLVGVEVGIPLSLLGMIFIGIGNSVGDMVNNLAMARRGMPEMAISAVFASHIMNLCISSGIGFLLLLSSQPGGITSGYDIYSAPEVIMALALLIVYDVVLIAVCVRAGYQFPVTLVTWLGRFCYLGFVCMAIPLAIVYDRGVAAYASTAL